MPSGRLPPGDARGQMAGDRQHWHIDKERPVEHELAWQPPPNENSRWWDLNPQPPLYESGALPLSYIGVTCVITRPYNHSSRHPEWLSTSATTPAVILTAGRGLVKPPPMKIRPRFEDWLRIPRTRCRPESQTAKEGIPSSGHDRPHPLLSAQSLDVGGVLGSARGLLVGNEVVAA